MNPLASRFFDPDVCRGYADYMHDREPKARGDKRRDRITRWLLLRTANALERPRTPYPEDPAP